jgi:hypothetical protein
MPVTQVPWSASSATIALVNVIKSLVRVAPSAGRRFFANSFFRRFPMSAARPPLLRAIGVNFDCGRVPHWKWTVRGPYSKDGKTYRFDGRNRNSRVRSYLCAGGLERASLMTKSIIDLATGEKPDRNRQRNRARTRLRALWATMPEAIHA